MKRIIIYIICLISTITVYAQSSVRGDQAPRHFVGKIYNSQYDIYIHMDLENSSIIVPQQEIFGKIPGYLGDNKDSRKWLITNATITSDGKASLSIINDYGSEDLKATLQMLSNWHETANG